MNELALFAGAGGGILGGHLLGWRTVCGVEYEPYPAAVLIRRQNDGLLPPFPVWDDVRTFDGRPWRGVVDVVSGGFPCQDISAAGKGVGITGARSGLWKEMHRIIREVRPRFAFMENSPMLTSRGLGCVLGDLAEIGYDAEWCVLGADDVGAPHIRKRIWILAFDTDTDLQRRQEQRQSITSEKKLARPERSCWWEAEPGVGRVADGLAHRVDRLKAIGNGQVPVVAAVAFRHLYRRATGKHYPMYGTVLKDSILISIRPEFAGKILSGEKIWEYRRRWGIDATRKAYIYATSPVMKIVGECLFTGQLIGDPGYIWQMTGVDGGIDYARYTQYFNGRETAHALRLYGALRYDSPINPRLYASDWRPPQSHCYFNLPDLTKGSHP